MQRRLMSDTSSMQRRTLRIRMYAAIAILLLGGALALQTLVLENGVFSLSSILSLELPYIYAVEKSRTDEPEPTPMRNADELILFEPVDIEKDVDSSIKFEILSAPDIGEIDLKGTEPRILIYHTHATEAYTPTDKCKYKESTRWRTNDETRSVIAVGEELARILRETYGIAVLHDTTNHEPPKLSSAYSRSVKTMEKYRDEHPSITMYIDLHRDAYNTAGDKVNTDYCVINGERVARLMFVVGTGRGATGAGFGEMPDFAANYALAKRMTELLAEYDEKLVRKIRVKNGRYNQHISNKCLLVEVGHNANTLEEALAAMKYLAAAIAKCAGENTGVLGTMSLVP